VNWFFAGFALALLLWFFALLYLKAFVRRRTSPDHILSLLQEEVRQLEADIDEKTEQDLALLEDKIAALREICAEADRRVAVLSRELRRGSSVPPSGPLVSPAVPPEAPIVVTLARPPDSAALPPPSAGTPAPAAAPAAPAQPPAVSAPAAPAPAPPAAAPAGPGSAPGPQGSVPGLRITAAPIPIKGPPLKDRIAELYRAGFAPALIAGRLGIPLGEVEVYIAMIKTG
jgi:hypothetical protein